MERIALTGLIKIEFPTHTLRLCDGGFKDFDGERYFAKDAVFGVITSAEGVDEGVGNEVPALDIEFSPPSDTPPADLSQPGFQRSRAQFWIAEYNYDTGAIIGEPDSQFDGQVDQTSLRVSGVERTVASSVVSTAERLFEINLGNSLSSAFHKRNNPGELGHDNASGLKVPIAWGATTPGSPNSGSSGGRGGGFAGGVFGRQFEK